MQARLMNRPDAALSAVRRVEPDRAARRIARLVMVLLCGVPAAFVLAPWRQSVSGSGRVAAYAPLDRRFNIESPIGGRVREWYVAEGTRVAKGQPVARISDNDPQYLDALNAQLTSARRKHETAEEEVKIYGDVSGSFEAVAVMAVKAAGSNVEVARQKVRSEEQERAGADAALQADSAQFQRIARLTPQGLASRRDYEMAEQKYKESSAKAQKTHAGLLGAESDLQAKTSYLSEVTAKSRAEVEKARAEVQKAHGKVAEANKEIQEVEVKVRRQHAQDVIASRDGTIMRLLVNEGSEQVKEGDSIAILVPDAAELAVEVWVDGNDAPLIHAGDPVRLQFEGWPAVQFAGWPSVAVGSFGGKVALVDSADNGKGKFRVLVRRNPDRNEPWPSNRYLRQGVRTKGWILLGEVSLGYEVWRQLNGFPQVVAANEPDGATKDKSSYFDDSVEKEADKVKVKRPKE